MRWPTHQAAAVVCAIALHLPAAGVGAALVGATVPDVLDQRISGLGLGRRGRQRLFNRIHRGSTHWFGWWFALFALVLAVPMPAEARALLSGLALGGLSHVGLDMLTPQGVPLTPFSRKGRYSLGLCRTGGLGEYAFLAALCGIACLTLGDDALRLARNALHGNLFLP